MVDEVGDGDGRHDPACEHRRRHHRLTDGFHHRPLAAWDPGAGGRELELALVRWREQTVRRPLVGQQRDIADEIAMVGRRGRRALN